MESTKKQGGKRGAAEAKASIKKEVVRTGKCCQADSDRYEVRQIGAHLMAFEKSVPIGRRRAKPDCGGD